jgi:hypothetical protein
VIKDKAFFLDEPPGMFLKKAAGGASFFNHSIPFYLSLVRPTLRLTPVYLVACYSPG